MPISSGGSNLTLTVYAQGTPGPDGNPGTPGATGSTGPAGDKGEVGDRGPTGYQGLQGEQGLAGDAGAAGEQGIQGIQGIQGVQGLDGDQGDKGPAGDKGADGDKGATGDQGAVGNQGQVGNQGPVGDNGATGDTGATGEQGIQGVQGPAGPGAYVCKQSAQVTNSSSSTPTDVTGMSFSLTSGKRYYFKFMTTYQTAATTTGVGFCFSSPAMTASNYRVEIRQGSAGTDQMYTNSVVNSLTTVLVSASVVAANTDYVAIIEGFCQPSEGGTLQLRCRTEVNASQITIQNTGVGFLVDAG